MLDAGDHDEQADEEEDGDPLDLVEDAVDGDGVWSSAGAAEIVEQQQERRAGQARWCRPPGRWKRASTKARIDERR